MGRVTKGSITFTEVKTGLIKCIHGSPHPVEISIKDNGDIMARCTLAKRANSHLGGSSRILEENGCPKPKLHDFLSFNQDDIGSCILRDGKFTKLN